MKVSSGKNKNKKPPARQHNLRVVFTFKRLELYFGAWNIKRRSGVKSDIIFGCRLYTGIIISTQVWYKSHRKTKNIVENIRTFYVFFYHWFSFMCWSSVFSIKDRNSLSSIGNTCSQITGVRQRGLCSLWENQVVKKAKNIHIHPEHVFSSEFRKLFTGYLLPQSNTNRNLKAFIPSAIRLLNTVTAHSD